MSLRKYKEIGKWTLIPKSKAKRQPDYIPENIRKAYYQACVIRDVNAKASAVMSRYCLQEMLRDFWRLEPSQDETLSATIDGVANKLAPETRDAIETVKRFGNIASYMREDVRLMVDASPDEAALLIDLVETLFKDFYEDRQRRKERSEAIRSLADSRAVQQQPVSSQTRTPPKAASKDIGPESTITQQSSN